MTPRTTQTSRPLSRHIVMEKPAKTMAQIRQERIERAKAALTPAQRAMLPSLSFSGLLYVIEHAKWPPKEIPLPNNFNAQDEAARGGKKNKKAVIPFEALARVMGGDEITSNAIYKRKGLGVGENAIRRALWEYAQEGLIIERKCGVVSRYRVAT